MRNNPRYETLFTGLKKNHPHQVALLHPLFFLLRRIIYAAIIIFLYRWPLFSAVALIYLTLLCAGFVINYHHWESSLINQQHIVNEFALYILLLFVLLSVGVFTDQSELQGTIFIGLLLVTMIYNIWVILVATCQFGRLFVKKLYNKMVFVQMESAGRDKMWKVRNQDNPLVVNNKKMRMLVSSADPIPELLTEEDDEEMGSQRNLIANKPVIVINNEIHQHYQPIEEEKSFRKPKFSSRGMEHWHAS